MDEKIQKYLLGLAHKTIAGELGVELEDPMEGGSDGDGEGGVSERPEDVILDEKRGVFVTLKLDGSLRGCIGNIMPIYPLEEAVKRNAVNAAFDDPRFEPLRGEEFEHVEIEISVLSVPEKLEYESAGDLVEKLRPKIDGVILKKEHYEATYLPQVWEEVPDPEMFLGSLCMKAGMPVDEWKKGALEVMVYQAEVF